MRVVHEKHELSALADELRASGARVGLVPTMGALHEGHMQLVDEARRRADAVFVTVFVNPLQFGPNEDFSRYPRTLDADVAACRARGVSAVFAPATDHMVTPGTVASVDVAELTEVLEGAHRPGHFRGVCTIVSKLFHVVGPSVAVFGRKDFQQYRVLERMTRDLDFQVEVVGMATVREADGLALSSRNRYLDEPSRARALCISRGLRRAYDAHREGTRDAATLEVLLRAEIAPAVDAVDYACVVDAATLRAPAHDAASLIGLVAVRIGTTRLIDNCEFAVDPRP